MADDLQACPNCQAAMNVGECCPECEHDERGDCCECEYCADNQDRVSPTPGATHER